MLYYLRNIETGEPAHWPHGRLKYEANSVQAAAALARITNRDLGGTCLWPVVQIVNERGDTYSIHLPTPNKKPQPK